MNEEAILKNVSTSMTISFLMYSFAAMTWKLLSEEQRAEEIKKISADTAEVVVKSLRAAGFEIVPVSANPAVV